VSKAIVLRNLGQLQADLVAMADAVARMRGQVEGLLEHGPAGAARLVPVGRKRPTLAAGSLPHRVVALVARTGAEGATMRELASHAGARQEDVAVAVRGLCSVGWIQRVGERRGARYYKR
jgi:hypothetical protein